MKQLAVISGKGGTGKTTFCAALASLASNVVLADCDVDAADLHLILNPTVEREAPFLGLDVARIDHSRCAGCGECVDHCRFAAITEQYDVIPQMCEGCGVCDLVCPVGAVTLVDRVSGIARMSVTRCGPMSHAELGIGEEASGLLTTVVRKNAAELAARHDCGLIIIDGPPGIGCPVVAAISGVDVVLVVVEPTVSGMHDLERVIGTVRHFGMPAAVAVNKSDINAGVTAQALSWCASGGIPVVGVFPFDESATAAMIAGRTLPEYSDDGLTVLMRRMWSQLEHMLASNPTDAEGVPA